MRVPDDLPATASLPVSDVRSALERVAASTVFQHSPQLQRFLRFIVEKSLTGDGDKLKEYLIGTEVFGRPSNYDPQLDSLVRVEAHRLRAALEEYYRSEGASDAILIVLNKGSYAPSFRRRVSPAPVGSPADSPSTHSIPWWIWAAVLALALLASFSVWLYRSGKLHHSSVPQGATIAVLPFDNLSADPEHEYFCFGLLDEITTDLAKTRQLRVIARTSAARFKRGDDITTIGLQLNADAILEGSVQWSAGRVRITAQLINASDRLHIWSDTFDRPAADLLRAQDDVAQAITHAVLSSLPGNAGAAPLQVRYSPDPQANQLYWKGSYFRTPMGKTGWRADLATSADYFEQAVRKDPQFALAYAALADVYVSLGWERGGGPVTRDFMTRGRHAAVRALELDGTLGGAHAALGTIQYFFDYDPAAAERSFQRALLMDPSNGKARMWYAHALVTQRRFDEARAQALQARQLDPLSYMATTHLAVVTFLSGRNDEAIALVQDLLKIGDTAPAHGLLGMALEVQQNYPAAIAQYQAGLRLVPNHAYIKGMLGHAYAMSGHREEAMRLLRDANLSFDEGGLSDLRLAYIYVGLGDKENVFLHLERDFQQRDTELPYINADPIFDSVRADPHFVSILQKIGLAN
jgi:TolB-like protein/tetratricopeptide (TPR) repeat protein